MRLIVPLTGKVLVENPLTGDDKDPVRPIDIDLGNVSWTMESIDLENGVMEIEVKPGEAVSEPEFDTDGKQIVDALGNPVYRIRITTDEEKKEFLQYAQNLVMNHTKEELYSMTGCSKLKRPFKQ